MGQKLLCYEWLKSNYSIFIYKVRGVFSLRLSFKGTDLLKRIICVSQTGRGNQIKKIKDIVINCSHGYVVSF